MECLFQADSNLRKWFKDDDALERATDAEYAHCQNLGFSALE